MAQGFLQIAIFCALIVAVVPLLGGYMARVFRGERDVPRPGRRRRSSASPTGCCASTRARAGLEGLRPQRDRLLARRAGSLLFLILRTQTLHPFNPEDFHSGTWDLSFNTASSFVTNTNWQYYGGETTMSYFSQMAGLAVQNFVSAAVGHRRRRRADPRHRRPPRATATLGNFWQDLVRASLYVLLPISIVGARRARLAGRPADPRRHAVARHSALRGPVASQEAIKELGTNGGGFFNVNSAYPFENPTALSNFFEMLPHPLHPGRR